MKLIADKTAIKTVEVASEQWLCVESFHAFFGLSSQALAKYFLQSTPTSEILAKRPPQKTLFLKG